MELTDKKREHLVIGVILFFWIRAILLNTVFQSDVQELAGTTDKFFRSVTLYGSIDLLVILICWYGSKGNLKMLGWQREGFAKHLGIGVLFGFGMIIQSYFLTQPLIGTFIPASVDSGMDVGTLLSDRSDLPFWILLAILKGGFVEELWRSFEINAFKRVLGKAGLIVGLVVGAVIFGISHSYQGLDSIISAGFDGLLYGLIYLRRRSVVEAMTAHAVYDIISILGGYFLF